MTNEPRYTIALIGTGGHGVTIRRAIEQSGAFRITACNDIDPAACTDLVANGARFLATYADVLADAAIDAVALVTPNDLHELQAVAALRAGKHVFVEKPMANGIPGARAMIAEAARAGRVLLVGHNTRRKRAFRAAGDLLRAGAVGRIAAVEATMARRAGIEAGLPGWKADPTRCTLLPMTQLGIHFVDVVHALIGAVETVTCVAASRAMSAVPDTVQTVMRTDAGVPVTLNAYYAVPDTYRFRIYGTDGVITCGPSSCTLRLSDGAVQEFDFSDEGVESFALSFSEMAACIENGTPPETDGDAALAALAVVVAMGRSIETGSTVTVRDVLA